MTLPQDMIAYHNDWIWTPNIIAKEIETMQGFQDLESLLEHEDKAYGSLVSIRSAVFENGIFKVF